MIVRMNTIRRFVSVFGDGGEQNLSSPKICGLGNPKKEISPRRLFARSTLKKSFCMLGYGFKDFDHVLSSS